VFSTRCPAVIDARFSDLKHRLPFGEGSKILCQSWRGLSMATCAALHRMPQLIFSLPNAGRTCSAICTRPKHIFSRSLRAVGEFKASVP
jgi:hypothetical protein